MIAANPSDFHLIAREVMVSGDVVETVEDVTLGGILGQAV
jgi:hypothetical protein